MAENVKLINYLSVAILSNKFCQVKLLIHEFSMIKYLIYNDKLSIKLTKLMILICNFSLIINFEKVLLFIKCFVAALKFDNIKFSYVLLSTALLAMVNMTLQIFYAANVFNG